MQRRGIVVLTLALSLVLAACGGSALHTERWTGAPSVTLVPGQTYSADVVTNYGSFTISLFAADDPVAVNNFVFLSQQHFYDGDKFFRIIQDFMVQTGDPNNNGTAGPGYRFGDELPPPKPYGPGIVAMANSGPNTNGSQFFICTGSQAASLPADYTELGQVTSGMDVVDKIAAIPVEANPIMQGEQSLPKRDAHIVSVTIKTGA